MFVSEEEKRNSWMWNRVEELVSSGEMSFTEALVKARAEWYAPRDPEPWELD